MEEATGIPGYFKNKGVLITGSTGFLGKSKHHHMRNALHESLLPSSRRTTRKWESSANSSAALLHAMHYQIVLTFTTCSCALILWSCLAAVLVEKILRVQPDVKRIYLPVRAPDAASAKKRVETEVSSLIFFSLCNNSSSFFFFCSSGFLNLIGLVSLDFQVVTMACA